MKGNGYNNHFINQKILDTCSKYEPFISGILVNKREYYMRNDNYLYLTDDIEIKIKNKKRKKIFISYL